MARTFRRSTSRLSRRRRRFPRTLGRNLFRPSRYSRAVAVGLGGTTYVSSVKIMTGRVLWNGNSSASNIMRFGPIGAPKSATNIEILDPIQKNDVRFYQLLALYDKVRIRSCSFELVVPVPAGTGIATSESQYGDTDQLQFGLGGLCLVSRFIRAGTKDTDVSSLGTDPTLLSVPGVVVTRSRNKDGYLTLRYNFAPRNAAEMNSWWSCRVYSSANPSLAEWVAGAFKDFSPIIDFCVISSAFAKPASNFHLPLQFRIRTVFEFRNGYVTEAASTAQQIQEAENQVKFLKAQAAVCQPCPEVCPTQPPPSAPDSSGVRLKKRRMMTEAERIEELTRKADEVDLLEDEKKIAQSRPPGYWYDDEDQPNTAKNQQSTEPYDYTKDPNCGAMCHARHAFNKVFGAKFGGDAGVAAANLAESAIGAAAGYIAGKVVPPHAGNNPGGGIKEL